MRDSIANELSKRAAQTSSPEFYVLIIIGAALIAWVAHLYFKFKSKAVDSADTGKKQNGTDSGDVLRIHSEDRATLQRIESKLDRNGEIFESILETFTHERGDLMIKLGEMSGRVQEISNRQNFGH